MSVIILDTETIGLRAKEDRICELAFIENSTGVWQVFDELIDPEVMITPDAMAVHHITNEMVEQACTLQKSRSLERLKALNTSSNILVLHNASFDLNVLENHGFRWKGEVIDTLACSKHLLQTPRHALQYLRYFLGLYKEEPRITEELNVTIEAHRALSDVAVTLLLFEHLLEYVGRLPEALVVLSSKPTLLKSIGFGKYRGQSFEQMVRQDRAYFLWCLESFEKLSIDARQTIEYWLKKEEVA